MGNMNNNPIAIKAEKLQNQSTTLVITALLILSWWGIAKGLIRSSTWAEQTAIGRTTFSIVTNRNVLII